MAYIISFVGSTYGGVPEWPKGTDCKSVGSAFEGSNPSPSTRLVSLQFCRLTFFVVIEGENAKEWIIKRVIAKSGDTVKIEMSPYDLTKGRITWRAKN